MPFPIYKARPKDARPVPRHRKAPSLLDDLRDVASPRPARGRHVAGDRHDAAMLDDQPIPYALTDVLLLPTHSGEVDRVLVDVAPRESGKSQTQWPAPMWSHGGAR